MDLIRSLTWISASHLRLVRDDDSHIDRLSHRYTVAMCVLFALIVSTKQYAGDPIDCWVPAQFKASYEKYADSYCWIAGSWYTPMDKELPLNERERRSNRIRYYQWVPFLLLFQAILCYIPRIIWRTLNVRSGLDLVNLVDASIKYESVDKFNDREKIMAYIVRNLERYIGARKSHYERLYGRQLCQNHRTNNNNNKAPVNHKQAVYNRNGVSHHRGGYSNSGLALCCSRFRILASTMCFWTGKRLGNYLVVLYMFVKTLWLINAVSQLFLLNRFIGNDYHAFGLEIIEMLLNGQEWHELRHFPRVTYCDFKIREIGNQHDWTVQCVLRINLFNEVIYIFLWFWLCLLVVFILVDYVAWTFRLLIPCVKLRFIKRHLDIYNFYMPTSTIINGVPNNQNRFAKPPQIVMNNNLPSGASSDPAGAATPEYSNNLKGQMEYTDVIKERKLIREFTFKYLKDDGIFAMRILAANASDLIVTEIMSELWRNFKLNHAENSAIQSSFVENLTVASESTGGSSTHSSSTSSASSPASSNLLPLNQNRMHHSPPQHKNNLGSSGKPYSFHPPTNATLKPSASSPPNGNMKPLPQSLSSLSKSEFNPGYSTSSPPSAPSYTATETESSYQKKPPQASSSSSSAYPNLQQRSVAFHDTANNSTSHHVNNGLSSTNNNANPNAKDTHV